MDLVSLACGESSPGINGNSNGKNSYVSTREKKNISQCNVTITDRKIAMAKKSKNGMKMIKDQNFMRKLFY